MKKRRSSYPSTCVRHLLITFRLVLESPGGEDIHARYKQYLHAKKLLMNHIHRLEDMVSELRENGPLFP